MKRIPGEARGRCSAVQANGLAYIVATDPVCADGISAQTANTLEELERLLGEVGSDKTQLLQATVYLSDIAFKPEMDVVWNDWIGPEANWPQRACVGVALDPGYLIEVVVTARSVEE
ncbi:Rid family hydrolase [Roseovarius rhodophyticola]|uniref:Rid family hydrolase n=1 Tax=Roseovarius rhodophyticola TaxID=3080827 RepID=A0ABZ2TIM4_9RHOB|nr:Rid family hydrolase [Roseovarius sp. W115]MDV2931376.1 Rid family hydrolase [Roseovarius sp. W115]